jgi:hypothetical protein
MAHAPQAWLMLKTYASSRMNSSGIEDPRHKGDVYGTDHGIKTRERAAALAIETDKGNHGGDRSALRSCSATQAQFCARMGAQIAPHAVTAA